MLCTVFRDDYMSCCTVRFNLSRSSHLFLVVYFLSFFYFPCAPSAQNNVCHHVHLCFVYQFIFSLLFRHKRFDAWLPQFHRLHDWHAGRHGARHAPRAPLRRSQRARCAAGVDEVSNVRCERLPLRIALRSYSEVMSRCVCDCVSMWMVWFSCPLPPQCCENQSSPKLHRSQIPH